MKIAVITAMPEERRAVARCLDAHGGMTCAGELIWRGHAEGHEVLLIESGMGPANAEAAAGALLSEDLPDLLVSAGFCGALSPHLHTGDVVIATRLAVVGSGEIAPLDVPLPDICTSILCRQNAETGRFFGGTFCTAGSIMAKRELAALLPADIPFPVVEMESAVIAKAATCHGIPFIGIRTVSDPVGEELGFTLEEFCDERLRIRPHRVFLTILRKPWVVFQLIRLARGSRIAAARLTAAVERMLSALRQD